MKKFLLGLLILLLVSVSIAKAAPKAELWRVWLAHGSASTLQVDHQSWQKFLDLNLVQSLDGINRLAYAKVSQNDKKRLDDYLESLSRVLVTSLTRSQQKAFWINLYNALTVKVVLDHYPVKSIFDINISPGWFVKGPWKKALFEVEGHKLSLDDIEHRILRPIWGDPRVHYAVNCASLGCPSLQPKAYTVKNLERLLDLGARDFINHARGLHFKGESLVVSSIYKWFAGDFGENDQAVIKHLKKYADAQLQKRLESLETISAYEYDWRLNDIVAE